MDKLEQLLTALKDLDAKLDALLAHDALTDEQRAEHDRLVLDRQQLLVKIDREKAKAARDEERAELEAEAQKAKAVKAEREKRAAQNGTGRLTDPDQPNGHDVPAERQAAAVVAAAAADKIPAHVKRYGAVKNFVGVKHGREADLRAYRFGMWALAQVSIPMPGRYRFSAALDFVEKQMAVVKESDASGYQYLVPPEFGQDLIDLREKRGVARRLFKIVPMVSDTRTDPRRQGGLTAYFVSEGAAGTESNKLWDQVRLTAKDLMVLSRYTNQLNADAVLNIGDDLAGEIAYAFADKEDKCAFIGDGSSTYGGILGATIKLTNIDGAGTASAGLVTGAGATWASLTLANFQTVAGALPQYADTPDAAWVAHRTFYYGVMQVLELAAGGVTSLEIQQGDRRPRPLFLGYPVEFSQVMPSATAGATVQCLLGNFVLGASLGDRQQDSIAFSEHANIGGENVFERNQIAIRGTERVDINVHDAGIGTIVGPIVGLKTA